MRPGGDAQVHLSPLLPELAVGHGVEGDVEAAGRGVLFEHLRVGDDVAPAAANGYADFQPIRIAGIGQQLLGFLRVVLGDGHLAVLGMHLRDMEVLAL